MRLDLEVANLAETVRNLELLQRASVSDHGSLGGLDDVEDHPYVPLSAYSTQGTILASDGSDPVALDAPLEGQVLIGDPASPTLMRFADWDSIGHTHDPESPYITGATILGGINERGLTKPIAFDFATAISDGSYASSGSLVAGFNARAGLPDDAGGFNALHFNAGNLGGWARGNQSISQGYGTIADGDFDLLIGSNLTTQTGGEGTSDGHNILLGDDLFVDQGNHTFLAGSGGAGIDGVPGDLDFAAEYDIVIDWAGTGARGSRIIKLVADSNAVAVAGRDGTIIGTGDIQGGDLQAFQDYVDSVPGAAPTQRFLVAGHGTQVHGSNSGALGVGIVVERQGVVAVGTEDGVTLLPYGLELGTEPLITASPVVPSGEAWMYPFNATAGNKVVNLQALDDSIDANEDNWNGRKLGTSLCIAKMDSSANTVTVNANAADSLDGSASIVLTNQYDFAILHGSPGVGAKVWKIVSSRIGGSPSTGHTIKENGSALTNRAGLNFVEGLLATDDAGNNETDVNVVWASDLADIATAEAAGTAVTVPRGDHVHAHSSGSTAHSGDVIPNDANQSLGAAYFDLSNLATPADPSAGVRRLFVDSVTGKISVRTSSGTTVSLEEGGGGGSVATDTIWDAKGDLAVGTGADTASRLAVGSDDSILMADSSTGTGLKWSGPATTEIADVTPGAESAGTSDLWARGDHAHHDPLADSWTSFTPTWTASVTNPAIGNGTLTGAYKEFGKTLFWWSKMTAGSTTTFGSGTWSIGIPTGSPANAQNLLVTARDAGVSRELSPATVSGGTFQPFDQGTGNNWTPTIPFTWTNGDEWFVSGWIELA